MICTYCVTERTIALVQCSILLVPTTAPKLRVVNSSRPRLHLTGIVGPAFMQYRADLLNSLLPHYCTKIYVPVACRPPAPVAVVMDN